MEQQQEHREEEIQVGDAVCWNYGAGKARGHVVEKLTGDRKLGSRTFKASPEEPKFLLKIDKTGKEAIRKGETLEKIDESAAAPAAKDTKKAPSKSKKEDQDEEQQQKEEDDRNEKSS